jgi:hypothetical protein
MSLPPFPGRTRLATGDCASVEDIIVGGNPFPTLETPQDQG